MAKLIVPSALNEASLETVEIGIRDGVALQSAAHPGVPWSDEEVERVARVIAFQEAKMSGVPLWYAGPHQMNTSWGFYAEHARAVLIELFGPDSSDVLLK